MDSEDVTVNDSFTVRSTPAELRKGYDLYSLIMSGKLPTGKRFRIWETTVHSLNVIAK